MPNIKIDTNILNNNIVEIISYVAKDISKNEIRRLIKSSAVKINNQVVNNEKLIVDNQLFKKQGFVKLSLGKKRHFKIVN